MNFLFCLRLVLFVISSSNAFNLVANEQRISYPHVIGHAGSSGYLPESSLEGYDLAANLLADYSEPDLVLTSDFHFIAMHDLTLEGTTNVLEYPEYADRKSTFVIEGQEIEGYYAINFTLAEIKGLKLKQRFTSRSPIYDWMFSVPSLQDIISWQLDSFQRTGRLVGILPELKHPDWYNSMGFKMEDLFIDQLQVAGYHINDSETPRNMTNVIPIAIQCFKSENLKYLSTITNIPLIQLMGISDTQPTPSLVYNMTVLDNIKTYAQAVGPDKKLFTTDWGINPEMAVLMRSWAAERNLYFAPWSFQQEDQYVPLQFQGDPLKELNFFYGCLESSAIFHEFPDRAREVVDQCEVSCFSQCRKV